MNPKSETFEKQLNLLSSRLFKEINAVCWVKYALIWHQNRRTSKIFQFMYVFILFEYNFESFCELKVSKQPKTTKQVI